jgi:hypothetical protein
LDFLGLEQTPLPIKKKSFGGSTNCASRSLRFSSSGLQETRAAANLGLVLDRLEGDRNATQNCLEKAREQKEGYYPRFPPKKIM